MEVPVYSRVGGSVERILSSVWNRERVDGGGVGCRRVLCVR